MALNIKNLETERLAQEVARATGESLTQAVTVALRQRLTALRREAATGPAMDVTDIQDFVARLERQDARSDDEILGYGDDGLPH